MERICNIQDNLANGNISTCYNIAHDLVSFAWNLELKDEVFISEVLESVFSNLNDTFNNYAVPPEKKNEIKLEIIDKLKPLIQAYKTKSASTLYNTLSEIRYSATFHQLTAWQKYEQPNKSYTYYRGVP